MDNSGGPVVAVQGGLVRSWRYVGLAVAAWVVALLVLLPGGGAEAPVAPRRTDPSPTSAASPDAGLARAGKVLAAWDARRARAWAADDAAALSGLYAARSPAAAADLRLLERWRRAGWRVEDLRTQVLGLAVVRQGPDRLVLRVVDRVAGGAVTAADDTRRRLASTPATTRLVELRRTGTTWRLVTSRRAGPLVSARG